MPSKLVKWRSGYDQSGNPAPEPFPIFAWDPLTDDPARFLLAIGYSPDEIPEEVDGHPVTVEVDARQGIVGPRGNLQYGWTAHYSAGPLNTTYIGTLVELAPLQVAGIPGLEPVSGAYAAAITQPVV